MSSIRSARRYTRVLGSVLVLTLSLAACGGRSGSVPPTLPGGGENAAASTRASASLVPLISVPKTVGALAFTDLGRRSASAPVSISLTLRYNNQAELDQFVANVSDPHSSAYGHVLTQQQFNSTYAPTVQQEASVVQALQKAGFTITQRFSNRTIVDATAPSATVEHFFSTEMHTVQQGKYGARFANLRHTMILDSL